MFHGLAANMVWVGIAGKNFGIAAVLYVGTAGDSEVATTSS